MMDYWISFVTSLDPNDSHGNISRKYSVDPGTIAMC